MNRLIRNRFTKGLSSGLSIFALLAVGYPLNGERHLVFAANGPSRTLTSPSDSRSKSITDGVDAEAHDSISEEIRSEHRRATSLESLGAHSPTDSLLLSSAVPTEFHDFHATAYCLKGRMASGEFTRRGVVAADPRVLPIGTVVHIKAKGYTGTYRVMDTGRLIKGKKIDVYMPSYREARSFGRQRIKLAVLSRPGLKRDDRKAIVAAAM